MFHRYFAIVPANTDALRDEVYRIRYEVYCEELGWEPRENCPRGLETDPYDGYSLHCLLLHKPSGRYAGCVRLVRPPRSSGDALPLQTSCAPGLYTEARDDLLQDPSRYGEISRLAVRARFRRRNGEESEPVGTPEDAPGRRRDPRRSTPHIAVGLYLAAAASGLLTGMEGVFALMEPRLARRLRHYGILFRQMGEPIEHRGTRVPYYISREDLYGRIAPEVRGLLDVVQGDLQSRGGWGSPAAASA